MESIKPAQYPYSRLFVYAIFAVIIMTILIGLTLSVGYSVLWEHQRDRVMPEQSVETIGDAKQALKSIKAVNLFRKELLFNVQRYLIRYRQDPTSAKETWNDWYLPWKKDLEKYGVAYKFYRPEKEMNKYEKPVAKSYLQLKTIEAEYSKLLSNFYELHQTKSVVLKKEFENAEQTIIDLMN